MPKLRVFTWNFHQLYRQSHVLCDHFYIRLSAWGGVRDSLTLVPRDPHYVFTESRIVIQYMPSQSSNTILYISVLEHQELRSFSSFAPC